jgi:hypothetical protein
VNRAQQIADRAQPDGQVTNISHLQITARYLDSDYEILEHDLVRGETGLLRVFALRPRTAGKARFEARWDDGSPGNRNRTDLDFDIEGMTEEIRRDFRNRRPRLGYAGHHSNRSSDPNQRIYEVEIEDPAGTVFEGEVTFNVTHSVGVVESVNVTATCDAVFIPASGKRPD